MQQIDIYKYDEYNEKNKKKLRKLYDELEKISKDVKVKYSYGNCIDIRDYTWYNPCDIEYYDREILASKDKVKEIDSLVSKIDKMYIGNENAKLFIEDYAELHNLTIKETEEILMNGINLSNTFVTNILNDPEKKFEISNLEEFYKSKTNAEFIIYVCSIMDCIYNIANIRKKEKNAN